MKALLSILLTLGLCACGSGSSSSGSAVPESIDRSLFPNVTGTVYGRWRSDRQIYDNGITFTADMLVNSNGQIGFAMNCLNEGYSLTAETTVPAIVTAQSIEIQADREVKVSKTVEGRTYTCSLTVHRIKFQYRVSGDSLSVSNSGQSESYSRN